MDLLKALLVLFSFYICFSTAAVVSGIEEELDEEDEEVLDGREFVQQVFDKIREVEYAAVDNKVKRQSAEDLNVHGDASTIQEELEASVTNGADLLDKTDIDTDSVLAKLFESMTVVENGEEKQPGGLHPDTDGKVQEESADSHGDADVDENGNEKKRGIKRNLASSHYGYWPGGVVPYTISSVYSTINVNKIKAAMAELESKTCIRFIAANSAQANALSHNSAVHFVNGRYCKSSIGRMHSYQQEIMLKQSACMDRATIVHEILHALGFYHEQARSDRNNYIKVHTGRIRHDKLKNFRAQNTINDVPYDAESVLQYNLYSFGKEVNGKVLKTMDFNDPKLEFLSDMAFGLDMYDIAEVNRGYECSAHCAVIPDCKNGGYVNQLCQCDCPSPLKGATCEQVDTDTGCGGIVDVSSTTTKTISSPNFPSNYPVGKKCVWLIRAPQYDAVKININELTLPHNTNNVCYHWLEIRYNLLGQLGPKRCGTFSNQDWITNSNPDDNRMILMFDSYFGSGRAALKGFQITATSEFRGCETHGCVFGTCVAQSSGGSKCQCTTGVEGTMCDQIKTKTMSCDFESGSDCFLKNDFSQGKRFWISKSGRTSSSYTGPYRARVGSKYVYYESSSPAVQGDSVLLTSRDDIFFTQGMSRCLSFYYHMYGSSMGTFNVYKLGSNGVKTNIFTKTGGQGRRWKYAKVTVTAIPGLQLSFEAVRGRSYRGDIGLDHVYLKPGSC